MRFQERWLVLGDWWWVGSYRPDGRTGHAYTAPCLQTLGMLWQRWILRRDVRWRAYPEYWLDPGERYEPAHITELAPKGHGVERLTHWPHWMMNMEWRYHRWQELRTAKAMGWKPLPPRQKEPTP